MIIAPVRETIPAGRRSYGSSIGDLQAAVAQRLGDMGAGDAVLPLQVGERAGDAQHAMVTARRKLQHVDGFAEERHAVRARTRDLCQEFAVGLRVRADALAVETRTLNAARLGDAGGDLSP